MRLDICVIMKLVILLIVLTYTYGSEGRKTHKKRYLQEFGYGYIPARILATNNVPPPEPIPLVRSGPYSGDQYLPFPPPSTVEETKLTVTSLPHQLRTFTPNVVSNPPPIIAIIGRSNPSVYAPLLTTPLGPRVIIIPILPKPHELYALSNFLTNEYGQPAPQPFNVPVVSINNELQGLETTQVVNNPDENANNNNNNVKEPLRIVVPDEPEQQNGNKNNNGNSEAVTIEAADSRKNVDNQEQQQMSLQSNQANGRSLNQQVQPSPSPLLNEQQQLQEQEHQQQQQQQQQQEQQQQLQQQNQQQENVIIYRQNQPQNGVVYSNEPQQQQQEQRIYNPNVIVYRQEPQQIIYTQQPQTLHLQPLQQPQQFHHHQQQHQQPQLNGQIYSNQNLDNEIFRRQTNSYGFTINHKK